MSQPILNRHIHKYTHRYLIPLYDRHINTPTGPLVPAARRGYTAVGLANSLYAANLMIRKREKKKNEESLISWKWESDERRRRKKRRWTDFAMVFFHF